MENNKNHILIVDDDDRIRDLLKDYLKKIIILFQQQKMLIKQKKIKIFKFDIIILDVMMPGQNGYELTKEIKKK
jgi:two-component system phosphate regulon response regulator OmpR